MKWWEKTVEYYFVKQHINLNMLFAPLDGKEEERSSDLVVAKVHRWLLIEFKKSQNEIDKENVKFHDYKIAKEHFKGKDDHHCIVYGALSTVFQLKGQTYFSHQPFSVKEICQRGIDPNAFNEYIEELSRFKKNYTETSGAGGSLACVAGVSGKGEITECLTLFDYANYHKLNHTMPLTQSRENAPSHTRSRGPRM